MIVRCKRLRQALNRGLDPNQRFRLPAIAGHVPIAKLAKSSCHRSIPDVGFWARWTKSSWRRKPAQPVAGGW